MYKKVHVHDDPYAQMLVKWISDKDELVGYYSQINRYINVNWHRKRQKHPGEAEIGDVVGLLNFLERTKDGDVEEYIPHITMDDLVAYQNDYCQKGLCETSRKRCWDSMSRLYAHIACNGNFTQMQQLYEAAKQNAQYEHAARNQKKYEVFRMLDKEILDKFTDKAKDDCDYNFYAGAKFESCSGIRPGEFLNLRTEDSIYGPGMRYILDSSGFPRWLTIDIRERQNERPLRYDVIHTPQIKVVRTVPVLDPEMRKELWKAYRFYLAMTGHRVRRPEGPLIVCQNSKYDATLDKRIHEQWTYKSYNNSFHNIADMVIQDLKDDTTGLAVYGELMAINAIGPHMFREYFTCEMFRKGYKWIEIMKARGDKCPETVILYLVQGGVYRRITIENANAIREEDIGKYSEDITKDEFIKSFSPLPAV